MPKIPDCDRCHYYSHDPHLVCIVHPTGIDSAQCLDFRPDPNAKKEEQWQPEGYFWYGNELIANSSSLYTPDEQLEILDTHPFFTGVCPACRYEFDKNNPPEVHYDCPACGWIDDAIH